MEGEAWPKARELAQGHRVLEERVEAAYRGALTQASDTDGLLELGHTSAALDVLAQRKDWERLWEMASREHVPPATAAKYAALQVNTLLEDAGPTASGAAHGRACEEAVKTLAKHGAPTPSAGAGLALYKNLVKTLLGSSKKQEAEFEDYAGAVAALREVLFGVMSNAPDQLGPGSGSDFEPLLLMTHYSHLLNVCQAEGGALADLACKVAVTLLRYGSVLPIDKLFHTAGSICQKQGHENLAFVLLNRYVDLTEAIEEGDAGLIDNSDFADVDHISADFELPPKQYLSDEDEREEVRDWVLSVCMDAKIEQQLPPAAQAQGTIYAGLYAAESGCQTCMVTGYPVQKWEAREISGITANKQDWNTYVRKTKLDPWTGESQVPSASS